MMQKRSLSQLTNIGIRGATLLSKFLLIFFLARFLEPAELGIYGLLVVSIGYSLYLVGFDFYTYSTRELLKLDRECWGGVLKSQVALTLLLYVVFLPILSLVFVKGLLPIYVAAWFFVLVVLEHITQELGRLLVAVSDQLYASAILFLRSGVWGVAVVGLMFKYPELRSLDVVLGGWTIGGAAGLVLGVCRLKSMRLSGWRQRVDWRWIMRGLKVASSLLLATLAIRGLFTLDRYWFEHLVGLEVLGSYVLYMGMCSALLSFLDAGVFAFIYPGLISAYQQQDAEKFRRGLSNLALQTIVLSIFFAVAAMGLIGPVLTWLDKPAYSAHTELFAWLMIATVLYALGMIPHFALYAQGQDRPIIQSHILSLLIFVVGTWWMSSTSPMLAVPMALCISFLFILCWKTWGFLSLTSVQYKLF